MFAFFFHSRFDWPPVNNPVYVLLATSRSIAPSALRWTIAIILLLEVARAAFFAASITHWGSDWGEPVLHAVYDHLTTMLEFPWAIARAVLALGLLLGLFTRIWGFLIIVLAFFSYLVHGTMEPSFPVETLVALVGIGLALMILGGGQYSLDRRLSKHLLPKIG